MASEENGKAPSDSSSSEPTTALVNGVQVPILHGISNYDAWRAKFEEAVKTKDPVSWRILNGETTDPIQNLEGILSEEGYARRGAAKRLKIGTQSVTATQLREFLDSMNSHGPLIRKDYAEALCLQWERKIDRARGLMYVTLLPDDLELPAGIDDLLGWAHLRFSNAGYHGQVEAWERWIQLRYEAERPQDYAAWAAFVKEFKSKQQQLEVKIDQTIPAQMEICQFVAALQKEPTGQARFEDLAAREMLSGCPIDMDNIYSDFVDPWDRS